MEATENNPGLVNPKLLNNKKFRLHQISVFCITAALYATLHASRTTWAYSKKSIENDEFFTDQKLSILDTTFMISYAFGLFYSGWLGDHSALKGFLARGAVISIFGFVMFTLLVTTGFHDMFVYIGLFLLSGYGQSREFPGIMAILGNWIEKSHRGVVIGAWNSCVNIGNIMGQQIGKFIIDVNHQSWSYVILTACGLIVFMVIVMLIFLKVTPKEAGLATREQELDDISAQAEVPKLVEPDQENIPIGSSINLGAEIVLPAETMKGIGFFEALKAPGLIRYGIIYACVKSSTYGLLFWLPNYLQTIIGFGSESANITATYEFGQFLGAILLGYCSDRIGKRSIVIVIGLYLSAIIFICLTTLKAGASAWVFGGLLFLAGFLFGGPEAIIGNIVSSDIGESKSLENNARALATTVGIIDGIGAVGAAIVQLIIPYLKSHSFFLYFGLCITAAIMITPIAIKEVKSIRRTESDHKELVEMAVVPDSEGI